MTTTERAQGAFEGLPGQIVKGFWAQGFLLMFKERVGAIIIYLYLRLHRYRARGGDIQSLVEQGTQQAGKYLQDNLPESVVNANTTARGVLMSTAEGAKDAIKNPGQTAEDVMETVSVKIVEVAKTARDALRGDTTTSVKDAQKVVKEAVETAKGEVKGAIDQAKNK